MSGTDSEAVFDIAGISSINVTAAFHNAHFATAVTVKRMLAGRMQNGKDKHDFDFGGGWRRTPQHAMLERIRANVAKLGTPGFEAIDAYAEFSATNTLDFCVNWMIVLLALYATWAHDAIVNSNGKKLAGTIEALQMYVAHGSSAGFVWNDENFHVSDALKSAIFQELYRKHKLIGPWRIHRTQYEIVDAEGGTARYNGPGILLDVRVPHCDEVTYFPFTAQIARNGEGVWMLATEYNASFELCAQKLDAEAAAIMEEALQKIVPMRIEAAKLREKKVEIKNE